MHCAVFESPHCAFVEHAPPVARAHWVSAVLVVWHASVEGEGHWRAASTQGLTYWQLPAWHVKGSAHSELVAQSWSRPARHVPDVHTAPLVQSAVDEQLWLPQVPELHVRGAAHCDDALHDAPPMP
jgi:hypothetical protein